MIETNNTTNKKEDNTIKELNPNDMVSFIKQSLLNVEKEIKKAKEYINNLVLTKRMYRRILQKIQEGK